MGIVVFIIGVFGSAHRAREMVTLDRTGRIQPEPATAGPRRLGDGPTMEWHSGHARDHLGERALLLSQLDGERNRLIVFRPFRSLEGLVHNLVDLGRRSGRLRDLQPGICVGIELRTALRYVGRERDPKLDKRITEHRRSSSHL